MNQKENNKNHSHECCEGGHHHEDAHEHTCESHHEHDGQCCHHTHEHKHSHAGCCEHTHNHEHNHSCCCEHDEHGGHTHEHSYSCSCGCSDGKHSGKKVILTRIILGIVLFAAAMILKNNPYLFICSYLILGYDVLINGIAGLFKKHIFSEHFLMSIASVGAFALGKFEEGCAVMLLYQIGEFFCDTASEKSEKSIRELIDIKPEYANLVTENGIKRVSPESLVPDSIVTVSVGEKIPADGIVIEGKSQLDTSSMTGEEEYSYVTPGKEVISGCINCGSLIKVKITKTYEESGVSKVVKLLDEIESNKSESEKFITVFAKYYTPIVMLLALLTFIVPPLFTGGDFSVWGYRALVFLVVSCPCALVISVPLTFFAANGSASRLGVLIKGSMSLEKLAKVKTIAFDKTGTLTKGAFKLEAIRCNGAKQDFLEMMAYAEYYSTHPLASVLADEYKKAFGKDVNPERISDYTEIGGHGISVNIDGKIVLVGNEKLLLKNGVDFTPAQSKFTVSYMAIDNKYIGYAEFTDGIKQEAHEAVADLKRMGITPALLSGDKQKAVVSVGSVLGIDNVHYELLPQDKVSLIHQFQNNGTVAFVGDGINDAPVISKADVGISMGLNGSDAAIEASDVVMLSDDIAKIPDAVKLSKRAMRIVTENIVFSIGIKVLIMLLGVFGAAGLWLAVFGDVGVSILAVANSLRAMKYNSEE